MTADELDARLATLPDDATVTLAVRDVRAVMAELRHAADDEIEQWMAAAGAHPSTEPWECGTCGGKVVGPSCAACTLGLAP